MRHPYPMRYNPYRHQHEVNPMSTGGKVAVGVGIAAVILVPLTIAGTVAYGVAWAAKKNKEMAGEVYAEHGGYDPAMNGATNGTLPNPCGR